MVVPMYRVASVLLAISVLPSTAFADEAACRVKGVTYVKSNWAVPRAQSADLHARLAEWGEAKRFHVGGVASDDPDGRPPLHTQTTLLQSTNYGVVLAIKTTSRNNQARVTISNNCWAPQESWKPYWAHLQSQLRSWGYRPAK